MERGPSPPKKSDCMLMRILRMQSSRAVRCCPVAASECGGVQRGRGKFLLHPSHRAPRVDNTEETPRSQGPGGPRGNDARHQTRQPSGPLFAPGPRRRHPYGPLSACEAARGDSVSAPRRRRKTRSCIRGWRRVSVPFGPGLHGLGYRVGWGRRVGHLQWRRLGLLCVPRPW